MIPLLLHKFFTYGVFVLSMLTNLLFIYVSTTTPTEHIGTYRYLLNGFATVDILVSITHVVLLPGIQLTSIGYIFFGYHLVEWPAWMGTLAGILFVVFFYQTFIVLALHFVYRYAVFCEPRWRNFFETNRTFWWSFVSGIAILVYTMGYVGAVLACDYFCEFQTIFDVKLPSTFAVKAFRTHIGFMPSSIKTEYYRVVLLNHTNINMNHSNFGYLAILFRKSDDGPLESDALAAIGIALLLFLLTLCVIVACTVLIIRELRKAQYSDQTLRLQRQLLTALIAQTSIPCLFSYIPLGMVFLVPLIGINLSGFYGDLLIMATAVFPAIDPLIMIYFVNSYRRRIITMWKERMLLFISTPPAEDTMEMSEIPT